ncbi:multicopper oxidase [Sphaerobolus stellatus SS14]|uniref:Multicopper oxidase n=1 Tax=Sphaerobolus stellatus (strain SS14) TaxID=990650 RepID=A0A0C9W2L3_SPHS4|nr:multicopper oxidase [Sphaerobolus stellatus SS14]
MAPPFKLLSSAVVLFSALFANAAIVSQTWTAAAKVIAPDGFQRTAALINGQYPGPLLKANKGDTVFVNLVNNLNDPTIRKSTSIHWHGIFQPRNAFNDGPSFVTQCPIAPNHTYTYQLVLGQQAGTFWYHSHLSTQYVDGIRGPLVIYDPNDPQKHLYDVDNENTIITLTDWYHPTALISTNQFINEGASEPVPDSGLINSAGRYSGGPAVTRTRINVSRGLKYRFRIISVSAEGTFDFAIDNHRMTIIEADGISTVPYTVDSVMVIPGQRYSVVVNANQTIGNYWIRATQTIRGATTQPSNPNFNGTDVYAVLHYAGADNNEPTTPQPVTLPPGGVAFQEFQMSPLIDPGAPRGSSPPDKVFNFTFSPGPNSPNAAVWIINGIQYQSPTTPTLLNILANKNATFGPNEQTFVLPYNATVEVSFIGGAGHAFHLHGHTFDVIQSASGGPPNYINPPRRDVVASGSAPNGNPVRFRFLTNNPGPWFVHCHIDWHLEAGLAAVFAEDPAGIRSGPQSVQPNPAWEQLCNIYNSLPASDQ